MWSTQKLGSFSSQFSKYVKVWFGLERGRYFHFSGGSSTTYLEEMRIRLSQASFAELGLGLSLAIIFYLTQGFARTYFVPKYVKVWFGLERGRYFHGSLLKNILFRVGDLLPHIWVIFCHISGRSSATYLGDLLPHIWWIFCHISGGNENKAKPGQLCWAWAGPELGNIAN